MTSTLNAVPGGSFFYDANDRLTTDTYDANGNTTSSTGISNSYDFENRMTAHGAVAVVYDGDGNRVSETVGGTTTKYLVDDLNPTHLPQVLDETVSGSVTRSYAYGLQRISENQLVNATWTPSFYGYDGRGSVRFLTNPAGTVTDTYQYDAFGMPIASSGTSANNYLYSGEQFDNSVGWYQLRQRWYRQATGRFVTIDPYEGSISRPATLHKYVYTRNDPVNLVDPTGREVIVGYLLTLTVRIYVVPLPVEPPGPVLGLAPRDFSLLEGAGKVLERGGDFALKARQAYKFGKCQDLAYQSLANSFGLLFDKQLVNGAAAGESIVHTLSQCYVDYALSQTTPY